MKKRIVGVAACLIVVLGAAGASPAQACTGSDGSQSDGTFIAQAPTGTEVYGDVTTAGGYAGAKGSTGYVEASGENSGSAQVDGASSDGAVDGRVSVGGSNQGACVNGVGT